MLPHEQGYYDRCLSNHTALWFGMLLVYFFILLIAVIVVAFKTSKIRYKNFKDAKATNIYAFLVSFSTVMTLLYWFFFRSLEISINNLKSSGYTLYVGHILDTYVLPIYTLHPKTLSFYRTTIEAME